MMILKFALIAVMGVGAQWLAWRLRMPAIVLLLGAGLVAGPVGGLLDPAADFGEMLGPLISVAVAIILFEGGLTLNFREIRETSRGVRRLVLLGAPIAFALGSLAGRHLAGLSWPSALVFGAIMVVTGPTVIMPLLRQARLAQRPASLLRWEAILADPLGALLAVLVFEVLVVLGPDHGVETLLVRVTGALAAAAAGGFALGRAVAWLFVRGHVPEYLKVPGILAAVLLAHALSDLMLEESGLLTVTVLGVTLANSRLASLDDLRRFKETMTVLLVSCVFVVLTATLDADRIAALRWPDLALVAALLLVVRPVSVWLSTLGTRITWKERLLVGWIAPRGVVAVSVSGLFGTALAAHGIADGEKLVALAFCIVFFTVILHGFSIGPLARLLGLASAGPQGFLLVGGSPWIAALAVRLKDLGLPVTVADRNWSRLREARQNDLSVFYGEILSEAAEHHMDFGRFGYLIAASDNPAYNALVCTDFGPELGRGNVYQIGRGGPVAERHEMPVTLGGVPLMAGLGGSADIQARFDAGWSFQTTRLTGEYDVGRFAAERPAGTIPLLARRGTGRVSMLSGEVPGDLQPEDVVLSFGPKPERRPRPSDGPAPDRPDPVASIV